MKNYSQEEEERTRNIFELIYKANAPKNRLEQYNVAMAMASVDTLHCYHSVATTIQNTICIRTAYRQ